MNYTKLFTVLILGLFVTTTLSFTVPANEQPPIEYREYNCTQWLFGDEYIDMCEYLKQRRQHGGYNCQLVGCDE